MARERLSMRKINEVLRLRFELKRSHRQIASSIGAASSTVAEYLIAKYLGSDHLCICTIKNSIPKTGVILA